MELAGLGRLRLIRESRLGGSRPDFAALHERAGKTHQIGYIELKAPGVVGVCVSDYTPTQINTSFCSPGELR